MPPESTPHPSSPRIHARACHAVLLAVCASQSPNLKQETQTVCLEVELPGMYPEQPSTKPIFPSKCCFGLNNARDLTHYLFTLVTYNVGEDSKELHGLRLGDDDVYFEIVGCFELSTTQLHEMSHSKNKPQTRAQTTVSFESNYSILKGFRYMVVLIEFQGGERAPHSCILLTIRAPD